MSEENNNSIGDPHWENNVESSYDNQTPETDGDDDELLLDGYSELETEDGCACYTPSVDSAELQEHSVNWISSPDPSSLDGYECGSDFEYVSAVTAEAAEPADDGAAGDAADNATEDTVDNVTDDVAAVSTSALVNDSRLDLRPVPASIDLTRVDRASDWREYRARVRAFARRLPFPEHVNRTAAPAAQPRPVRLAGGQPTRSRIIHLGRDPDYGGFMFIRDDTDEEEEEPPLKPPAMVPRRGNSVSDLSQCSSDEEINKKKKRRPKPQ